MSHLVIHIKSFPLMRRRKLPLISQLSSNLGHIRTAISTTNFQLYTLMDLYYYILHIYVRYTIPFNIHNNRKHFQLIIQRSFLLCCTFMLDIHIEYTPIVRNIISLFFIFTLLLLIKKHPLFVLSHIAFFLFLFSCCYDDE